MVPKSESSAQYRRECITVIAAIVRGRFMDVAGVQIPKGANHQNE